MKSKILGLLVVGLLCSVSTGVHAVTSTYAGTATTVDNCIPFGCPDVYGPHMGFVYRDIAAFTLNIGDIIAFDTGRANDYQLSFNLSLGTAAVNGGTVVDGNGFTQVAALPGGLFGDAIVGNYDIAFVASQAFSFAGGGLIVDFENANGPTLDQTSEQNLVWSSNNPYAVARYFYGGSAGQGGFSPSSVGNMRIITGIVPEPGTLALLALGLAGLGVTRRR